MTSGSVVIVGAGIFGVTAAIALRRRGHVVTLVDPGPIPHPLAESTDISKVIRLEYGADAEYTAWMETALEGWRRWNARWPAPLFHETGVMFLSQAEMRVGGFEHDSYEVLRARGHRPERLDPRTLRERFPAWDADRFVDGYFNPEGGWVESGAVVTQLFGEASSLGVRFVPGFAAERLLFASDDDESSRVTGVVATDGKALSSHLRARAACGPPPARVEADVVVVAAGAWTPHLLPSMAPHLRSVGQPVFHVVPPSAKAKSFEAETFPVFGADIARTGWYGFPLHAGVVKIANHGIGRQMHPESSDRSVTGIEERSLRELLRGAIPSLADAPIVHTRVCVYCDTWDQHFWIAPDPAHPNLIVAAGGSGHAFKFAPLIGDWIADAVSGVVIPRFRWRPEVSNATSTHGEERARHQE